MQYISCKTRKSCYYMTKERVTDSAGLGYKNKEFGIAITLDVWM